MSSFRNLAVADPNQIAERVRAIGFPAMERAGELCFAGGPVADCGS